ncbi:MAG: hypothetical protein GXO76_07130, partial [Calditrichaeota bacterium]|nr:hypothetical protein [Calditrichota bacterium]
MIRVYGFSLDSDWRFLENQEHLLVPRAPKIWGMDIRFPHRSDKKLWIEFARKNGIPEWEAQPADERSCRLMVTREQVDHLIEWST